MRLEVAYQRDLAQGVHTSTCDERSGWKFRCSDVRPADESVRLLAGRHCGVRPARSGVRRGTRKAREHDLVTAWLDVAKVRVRDVDLEQR